MAAGVQRESTSATRLVLLVTAALFINYIDRGSLATAAPLIQDELHLSASQLGFLLSAFYYGYVLCMAPAGWLAERYGAHKVLAAGLIIWSLATLGTGLVHGFTLLLASAAYGRASSPPAVKCLAVFALGAILRRHAGAAALRRCWSCASCWA